MSDIPQWKAEARVAVAREEEALALVRDFEERFGVRTSVLYFDGEVEAVSIPIDLLRRFMEKVD